MCRRAHSPESVRRPLLFLGGSIGTLVVLLGIVWAGGDPPELRADLASPAHEMAPGLFSLGTDRSYGYTAAYALRTDDGIALIDPGLRAETLERALRRAGLRLDDVRTVLITHRHADHWFAAREVVARTGATVMAHRDAVPFLKDAAGPAQYYAIHDTPILDVPTLEDVRPLEDGDVVRLGDLEIEVLATPGHTQGSVCFRTRVSGHRVLFTGDTVLAAGVAPYGGEYMTRLGPAYGGDLRRYVESLRRLRDVEVDLLLPGHPLIGSDQDALLGDEAWKALVDRKLARLEGWLAEPEGQGTRFLDGRPQRLSADLFYLGESAATATYVLRTSEGLLCVDPGRRPVEELFDTLRELRLSPEDLRLVLLTGTHPDHATSVRALRERTGARLVCGRELDTVAAAMPASDELAPDRRLAHGEELEFGGARIVALEGALDAGADVCYLIHTPGRRLLFGGDTVGRFAGPSRRNHGSGETPAGRVRDTLRRVSEERVHAVLPAHPRYHERPFYFEGEWQTRTTVGH